MPQLPPAAAGPVAVNGLAMYHAVYGPASAAAGEPLLLIHGAFGSIDSVFGPVLPGLAASRRVIAVELQGHGRTADIDRPLTYEQMADDVAALMQAIGVETADIFGFSMGGAVTLQLAIRHPVRVRRLVVAAATFGRTGFQPAFLEEIRAVTPEALAGSEAEAEYKRLAPDPAYWPHFVTRMRALNRLPQDWSPATLRAIGKPALVVVGDRDVVTLEHALATYRHLGGEARARLVVLPDTDHLALMTRSDLLHAIVPPFLDAPAAD